MAKILVVDDHAINRELIVTLLAYKGHESFEANDGAEALDVVRREHPALVICDILMPTMDGYEFVRQLRADPTIAATSVIFYSAYYREEQARNLARSVGVEHVLPKPSEPEAILHAIEMALGTVEAPAPAASPEAFDREHLRLLTDELSDKVEKLQHLNQRMSALTALNLQIASERDPRRLLEEVCRVARDLIGAGYAVLCVRGRDAGTSPWFTSSGIDRRAYPLSAPTVDDGILGGVCERRQPLRIANPGGDPRAIGLPADYPPASSMLASPIASLDVVYGWICLANKVGDAEFSEDDERLLEIHAAQVGRVYETGSLYARIKAHADELSASDQRFRQVTENIHQMVFLANPALTELAYVSPACQAILGFGATELVQRPRLWIDAIHPADRQSTKAAVAQGKATGFFDVEHRILRPDGEVRWVRARGYPIAGPDGALQRIAGICEDVTNHKLQEDRIRRLNRVQAVLSAISTTIVRVRDRDELLREACRIAVDDGGFRLAWAGTVEASLARVHAVASHGAGEDYVQRLPLDLQAAGGRATLAQAVIDEHRPVVVHDMENDPRIERPVEAHARGLRSVALFPLEVGRSVVAMLALYSGEPNVFDEGEMKLLRELAGNLTLALENIAHQERLDYLALYDPLTGLPNRSLFLERLAHDLQDEASVDGRLAVVMFDIEGLNHINDTLGRAAGDVILKQVAERALDTDPHPDRYARLVGDQFVLSVPDLRNADVLPRLIAQKTRDIFSEPFRIDGTDLRLIAKFGIALFPNDGTDAESLLRNAEAALKRAKATSERYLFYTQQMTEQVASRLALETELRNAFEREEFVMYYQPKVEVDTRRIVGAEALIRWQSPTRGLVPPLRFISLLEETGMILEVGKWVLRRAIEDYRRWLDAGLQPPPIAVNVSPMQLRDRDFVETTRTLIASGGNGVRSGIDLEITEGMLMTDVDANVLKLKTIRDMGLSIAIDDFGTGYSSLSYLAKLPVQSLKIDRMFIATMTEDADTMTLVATMISLAHALRLNVVAEGVETEDQARMLSLLRCDQMQGFLIGHPVPRETFEKVLAARLR